MEWAKCMYVFLKASKQMFLKAEKLTCGGEGNSCDRAKKGAQISFPYSSPVQQFLPAHRQKENHHAGPEKEAWVLKI